MKPERANAVSLARITFMPKDCAPRSFSRSASSTRPVRLRRMPRTREHGERRARQAEVVVRPLRVEVDDAEQLGSGSTRLGRDPPEVAAVQQVARRGHGERQRGHGQEEAAQPQRGQADDDGDDRADEAGRRSARG